jgi:cytokinin dehydrogenase
MALPPLGIMDIQFYLIMDIYTIPLTGYSWRKHFGSAWEELRDAKRTFDPRHVLTPGYEVF